MSLSKTNDIAQLTEVVFDHLTGIQEALRAVQSASSSDGAPVSEQLETLLSRVRTIEVEAERTRELVQAKKATSDRDELTSLPNREAYEERASHELRRFKRYHRPLTLALCDIDEFQKVNSQFGHRAGDKTLHLIAKFMVQKLRSVDFVARLSAENFVLILPETTEVQALLALDKLRDAIHKIPFRFNQEPFHASVSFGISEFVIDDSIDSAFTRADTALQYAKTNGRNLCQIESAPEKEKLTAVQLKNVKRKQESEKATSSYSLG